MKWFESTYSDNSSASTSCSHPKKVEGDTQTEKHGQETENEKYCNYELGVLNNTKATTDFCDSPDNSCDRSTFDEHKETPKISSAENIDHTGATKKISDKNKRLLYGVISTCLLVIIVIILAVGVAKGVILSFPEDIDGSSNVSSPSSEGGSSYNSSTEDGLERADRLYEYLITVGVDGVATFNDPISPESQALAWMQHTDPVELDPIELEQHYRINQRFALLTLWFQSDYDWFNQTNWLSEDECAWKGVICMTVSPELSRSLIEEGNGYDRTLRDGDKIVKRLNLEQNNLQGNLPPNLPLLIYLTSLNLSGNQINGEIRETLRSMTLLEELYLHDNNLSQEVSLDFSLMSNLVDVNLSNNQFEGTIPDSLYSVASITRIQLDNNIFSGQISGNVGNLVNLCKSDI